MAERNEVEKIHTRRGPANESGTRSLSIHSKVAGRTDAVDVLNIFKTDFRRWGLGSTFLQSWLLTGVADAPEDDLTIPKDEFLSETRQTKISDTDVNLAPAYANDTKHRSQPSPTIPQLSQRSKKTQFCIQPSRLAKLRMTCLGHVRSSRPLLLHKFISLLHQATAGGS
ncbi:hypothetical protein BV22DRAFT_1028825 [Leucogyrophana mollusca]|uniref:Uncharacterized protein n=1 Tax=Leucogyrophana mollusca TaxID=85980 RepID=A0ACB8BX04_9AGAM|nr:hypothetical protein BV22DRAFT_1028825 [Leucogyrophana mollusca]